MNKTPNCPKCKAVEVVKNGKTLGKQRFKCKMCNFQFTFLLPRGYPPETKAKVIELYNHGLSIRTAAKLQMVTPRETAKARKTERSKHFQEITCNPV